MKSETRAETKRVFKCSLLQMFLDEDDAETRRRGPRARFRLLGNTLGQSTK